jgi:sugar lactone lactonase YvrE
MRIEVILLCFSLAKVNLSPQAAWDQNGVTIIGSADGTSGSFLSQLDLPRGISISRSDVLYISDTENHRIVVVHLNSITDSFAIGSGLGSDSGQFNAPRDVFVTSSSLYISDFGNRRVQKSSLDGSNAITVATFGELDLPKYLYIDNNANIYVSDSSRHSVLFFRSNATNFTIVAGTGVAGSNDDQLDRPFGVFVNDVGTIYIADCYNHRIMKWLSGASSGVRIAGDGTPGDTSAQVHAPTQIIVDENEYMYISESFNGRITRWAPNANFGLCIVACSGISGTASTQLSYPHSLAFDSNGSLYVSDYDNHRIQKFQILNYRGKYFIHS